MMRALKVLTVLFLVLIGKSCARAPESGQTSNKKTVAKYMEGFNTADHAKILSCVTEDVEWELPGVYHHKGKIAFDKEIENEAFTGKPVISITRMTEQDNVVIAEGTVLATKKDGTRLVLAFCDVFEMENGLIKKLTSYLMPK